MHPIWKLSLLSSFRHIVLVSYKKINDLWAPCDFKGIFVYILSDSAKRTQMQIGNGKDRFYFLIRISRQNDKTIGHEILKLQRTRQENRYDKKHSCRRKKEDYKKKQKTHFYENLMNQNHSQAIEINYSMIQNLSKEKTFQKEGKKQPLSNDLAWNKKVWPKNY